MSEHRKRQVDIGTWEVMHNCIYIGPKLAYHYVLLNELLF